MVLDTEPFIMYDAIIGGGIMNSVQSFDQRATNLCKGIAICIMVYFHLFGAQDETTYHTVIPVIRNVLAPYGNVCVVFFVLLTGYGFAAKNLRRREPYSRQILHRFLNLYQSYWIVFLLMLLIYPFLSSPERGLTAIYGTTVMNFVERLLLDFLGLAHFVFKSATCSLNQTWWYMGLAILLILLLPLLCSMWRAIGWGTFGIVLVASILFPDIRYLEYFPAAALGVCLAGGNGFVQIQKKTRRLGGIIIHFIVVFLILFMWYRMRQHSCWIVQADTFAAYGICQFAFDLLFPIPGLHNVLQWLGKHSANVFYVHSFVLVYWPKLSRFVYSFQWDWLIFFVTLGISLILSLIIEQIKKRTMYNQLFAFLGERWMGKLPMFQTEDFGQAASSALVVQHNGQNNLGSEPVAASEEQP